MGMGMSVSPQIWQQFIDLVFQDDLIKHKQIFDVVMDDTDNNYVPLTQVQISLCAKIGYTYYCEYAHTETYRTYMHVSHIL